MKLVVSHGDIHLAIPFLFEDARWSGLAVRAVGKSFICAELRVCRFGMNMKVFVWFRTLKVENKHRAD